MKKLIIFITIILLILIACDRFDNSFEPDYQPPTAKIEANTTNGPSPLTVFFENISTPGTDSIKTVEWDFNGDSIVDTTNVDSVSHIYTEIGVYKVLLTVSDDISTARDSIYITVSNADFSYSPTPIYAGRETDFHNESQISDSITANYTWDFNGDDIIDSELENPVYTFEQPGYHHVSFKIIDSEGISDTISITKEIYVYGKTILSQVFTSITCTYCPYMEGAFESISSMPAYENTLLYIEYHVGDNLDYDNLNLLAYYSTSGTLPLAVIQGYDSFMAGSQPENLEAEIENYLQNEINQISHVRFYNITADIFDNELNGSVDIEFDADEIDHPNLLFFKYVLMDKFNDNYTNAQGDYLHNIVLKRDRQSLATENIEELVKLDFELTELNDLASGYHGLPEDLELVIFVQTIPASFNQEQSRIYNAAKITIE